MLVAKSELDQTGINYDCIRIVCRSEWSEESRGSMIFEHWIYSVALGAIFGLIYYMATGKDYYWIIVASAYAPDIDIIANPLLKSLGATLLIYGRPIHHGDFHNIAAMMAYGVIMAFLLHPLGIELLDSFIFASVGFAAHLFEDALVFDPGYRFLWPITNQAPGIGLFSYSRDFYGIADREILSVGLVLMVSSLIFKAVVERAWRKRMMKHKRV